MIKPPTPKAVATEVATLTNQSPRLPISAFGDDNQGAISAQIFTLKNRLSEYQIYDKWDVGDGETEDDAGQHALEAALDAGKWLRGESPQPPSRGWQPIVNRALAGKRLAFIKQP